MTVTTEAMDSTVTVEAGAASHSADTWHQTNWNQAHRLVRRLQARIVKAVQEERWGKVQALQRLLTHSYSGKLLAVKRVTENQGKTTAGVDGITWETPDKKMAAIHQLWSRGYHPQPLRRVYIPKKNGKMRPLGIPTMKDRAMQALYLLALAPIAECLADGNSYGFRPGRSAADALSQCHGVLSKKASASWILEGDIQSCFDKISHDWLLAHIPLDKTILSKWLKAGYMDQQALYPTKEGTPQGGPLSPVLANLALDGLERILRARFPKPKTGFNAKVNFVRYADDFCISGCSQEILEQEVKPLVVAFLQERGLTLSPDKTVITHIDDGFDFLGQTVRKYNGKMLIKPSKKSVQAFLATIRKVVKENKQASAGHLICQLNPIIRGWAMYHRHAASKETFRRVDSAIFRTLWQWAKRRHPRKGARWIMRKYFRTVKTRKWVFFGEVTSTKGVYRVHLYWAKDLPIRRHVKIRTEANPYDPQWEEYFEQRLDRSMVATFQGRTAMLHLWKEQQGLCPHCHQKITKSTGWHSHHIVWRSKGGSDTQDNRVLLHPTCHRAIHAQGILVEKPRPVTRASQEA